MKKISMTLDSHSVAMAIAEVEKYRTELERKTELLRERIGNVVQFYAEQIFSQSVVDDIINGGKRWANVDVTVQNEGDTTVVVAHGQDAVFVEFGAGIHHNVGVGESEHPEGAKLGFTIGSFGTNGRRHVWGFYEDGELVLTHGTPATMPMYTGLKEACNQIAKIAREVFNS